MDSNADRISLANQRPTFAIQTHTVPSQSEFLVEMTPQRRAFFIIFGIGYLFVGGGAIALEILIVVYSYSSYLRGLWTGNVMLVSGVVLIIVAVRKSQSFCLLTRLLTFNLNVTAAGMLLSSAETVTTKPCDSPEVQHICDSETGKILKLVIVGELIFSGLYSMLVISYLSHIKSKTQPRSPQSSTRYPY